MTIANLDRYRKDIEDLVSRGDMLELAMQVDCFPTVMEAELKKTYGEKTKAILKKLPDFRVEYQTWYSEAKALIKQLLPDRLSDFSRHYEKPKARKDLTNENYHIEDYLQGINVTLGVQKQKVVGPDAAIPRFRQQLAIVRSASKRLESSLFDIRQLVQADIFDSELEVARELARKGFTRASGAIAGVVLEHHLGQVSDNHGVRPAKKNPTIADFNDALKNANVLDTPGWRFIQHLGDLRNLCDHKKSADPSAEQVEDLIAGVARITKTLF